MAPANESPVPSTDLVIDLPKPFRTPSGDALVLVGHDVRDPSANDPSRKRDIAAVDLSLPDGTRWYDGYVTPGTRTPREGALRITVYVTRTPEGDVGAYGSTVWGDSLANTAGGRDVLRRVEEAYAARPDLLAPIGVGAVRAKLLRRAVGQVELSRELRLAVDDYRHAGGDLVVFRDAALAKFADLLTKQGA